MILNYEKLTNQVVDWIKDYATNNGKTSLIVYQCLHDRESMAAAMLCVATRLHTIVVESHGCTTNLFNDSKYNIDHVKTYGHGFSNCFETLRKLANSNNGLIIDPLTRSHLFCRSYAKNFVGDMLPFGDLYLTEAIALASNMPQLRGLNEPDTNRLVKEFTPEELEWADRENQIHDIIYSWELDPIKHKEWGRYSMKQKEIIAKLHQIEKMTRHKKELSAILLDVRSKKELVR